MNENKIGIFISNLRKEKELTQKELGDLIHVTDKAVSKWERGMGLPDIAILRELAKLFDVSIEEILNGEKNTKQNIEEKFQKIKEELINANRQRIKKISIIIVVLIFIIIYVVFRNVYIGFNIKEVKYEYENKLNVGVPKFSFMTKSNDHSFLFRNLRNPHIVENEIKEYLSSLKYSVCNDTIYYYEEEEDFSIINYDVKNSFFYNTISYQIVNGDYCFSRKIEQYEKKLNGLKRIHSMNFEISSDDKNVISIILIDGGDDVTTYKDEIELEINYIKEKGVSEMLLEKSKGYFEIKDDFLYYFRNSIIVEHSSIKIPKVSAFKILDNGKLELVDNYLSKYDDSIILK